MNDKFIYDETTSKLYAPDGQFLKSVYCPKAKHWNQLLVEPGEDRWRNCKTCEERVIDLDVVPAATAITELGKDWRHVCIHVSEASKNVVFLRDGSAIPPPENCALSTAAAEHQSRSRVIQDAYFPEFSLLAKDPVFIRTARSIDDINRAAQMGYWPDVRWVVYDTEALRSKVSIEQNKKSGCIRALWDYREDFLGGDAPDSYQWSNIIPWQFYYDQYQAEPIAAYLIPKGTPDGTEVLILDPIEDIQGKTSNQGNTCRARNVPGYIEGKKVVVRADLVTVCHVVG